MKGIKANLLIACCSGFDTTFRPKFPIIGANGINLQDKWKDYPVDAYMAVTVADMPNVSSCLAIFGQCFNP